MKELTERMESSKVQAQLHELLITNKLYHAIVLACPNQKQLEYFGDNFLRMMVCANNSQTNDSCEMCVKYEKNTLLNLIKIGDGVNQIKKEEINNLITTFGSTTFENSNKRIYLIRNVENMNEMAANSILKFLEEPGKEVFAVLLTNDKSQIMPTIKSRCKIIVVSEEQENIEVDQTLLNLIRDGKKTETLLYSDTFKKKDKKEQVDILNYIYKNEILLNKPSVAEVFLDVILEIKNSSYTNLIIENFFIRMFEAKIWR